MKLEFLNWEPDPEVCGEAAGLGLGDRLLDLVVTYAENSTFLWEVVDEVAVIAAGAAQTATAARQSAYMAARRALIRLV